jgi:PAS domain-containing protein
MPKTGFGDGAGERQGGLVGIMEFRRQNTLLKTGALQDTIFNNASFSCIATDEKGVIQLFNVGAERMLGYAALGIVNRMTPADISDSQEEKNTELDSDVADQDAEGNRALESISDQARPGANPASNRQPK